MRISDWSSDVCSSDLRITPGLNRSAPDSLTLAGPVLNAIRREDWETLRRKGDVVVPEGYQSVPFMRGDPISAPPPAAAEQSDPRPVASPTEPEKPLQPVDAIEGEGSSLDAAESKQESAGPSPEGGQGERKVAPSAHQPKGTRTNEGRTR